MAHTENYEYPPIRMYIKPTPKEKHTFIMRLF